MTRLKLNPLILTVLAVAVSVAAYLAQIPFLEKVELSTIDLRFISRGDVPARPEVVLAVIDEKSINQEGKWVWPRAKFTRLVEKVSEAGARVLAFDIGFLEEDDRTIVETVAEIQRQARRQGAAGTALDRYLETLQKESDSDRQLARAIADAQTRVVLGYFFHMNRSELAHLTETEVADHQERVRNGTYKFARYSSPAAQRIPMITAAMPQSNIAPVSRAAGYAGYFNMFPDTDGVVRWIPAVISFRDALYAPLSLMTASAYLDEPLSVAVADYGVQAVRLGKRVVPTDELGRVLVNYRGPAKSFPHLSVTDILHDRIDRDRLAGKIVMAGATAVGIFDLRVTPFGSVFPGLEIHANVVDSVLAEDFLHHPSWAAVFDMTAIVLLCFGVWIVHKRTGVVASAITAILLFGAYIGLCQTLFVAQGWILNMVYPLLALVITYVSITAYKYIVESHQKRFIRDAFSTYLAPSVVRQLIESPESLVLGGEEREITAFFSDVQGFTGISERLSAAELVELLNEFLTEMTDIILNNAGTVDKFEGDAIIAFFGAPNYLPNHAETACRCCLQMQQRLDETAGPLARPGAARTEDAHRYEHRVCRGGQHGLATAHGLYDDGRQRQYRRPPRRRQQGLRHLHHGQRIDLRRRRRQDHRPRTGPDQRGGQDRTGGHLRTGRPGRRGARRDDAGDRSLPERAPGLSPQRLEPGHHLLQQGPVHRSRRRPQPGDDRALRPVQNRPAPGGLERGFHHDLQVAPAVGRPRSRTHHRGNCAMGIIKKHPTLFLGLGITLLFFAFGIVRLGLIETLDLKLYDMMMGLRGDADSPSDIVMVEVDDDSIDKLGRWPWPRSLLAEGIAKINRGGPRAIGMNFILSEAEKSTGLAELRTLRRTFAENLAVQAGTAGESFLAAMDAAQDRLDNDRKLAAAVAAAGNVVLPVYFGPSTAVSEMSAAVKKTLAPHAVTHLNNPYGFALPRANEITLPIDPLLEAARGIGHINLAYDLDGTARRERLIYDLQGLYVPSYTLRLAALFRNVPPEKIDGEVGGVIRLGDIAIPTTANGALLVSFKGPRGSFKRYSFFDVINDKIPPAVFKNKLVLVGASAAGLINPLSTPTDATMPLCEFSAHAIWSMLTGRFVEQPAWSGSLKWLLLLMVGLVITVVLPRLKALYAGIAFWGLLAALIGGAVYSFTTRGLWVPTVYPLLQLILGYIGVLTIQYFVTETGKEKVEGESAETNRMLGLSFQSQGMLDMAFDKFRRVPVDDQMKDILYNLALDYERKRQFNKAAAVFEYVEEHDPKFKDVHDRKARLMQASETMVFGDGMLGGGPGDSLLATSSDTRPTLGRYEVMRQLGKGAMGIVYLGQDPRINRTVAIKTFRFHRRHRRGAGRGTQAEILSRGRERRHPFAPQHRHHLRRGRRTGPGLHRHGVSRRRGFGALHQKGPAAAHAPGDRHRGRRGRRAGLRPPEGHRAPGRQAGQHHDDQERAGEDHRFRHRPHHRHQPDPDRGGQGDPLLHVAGAVLRRTGRRPFGHLFPRDHAVSTAHRPAALSRRQPAGADALHHEHAPPGSAASTTRASSRRWPRSSTGRWKRTSRSATSAPFRWPSTCGPWARRSMPPSWPGNKPPAGRTEPLIKKSAKILTLENGLC